MEDSVYNPFSEIQDKNDDDILIIKAALQGDCDALEKLIFRHQAWIYNIALKMVFDPDDACDVTQEILIKIITRLSSYNHGRGSFRTWVYRIVANHVITMKNKHCEERVNDMDAFFSYIDDIPDDRSFSHPDYAIILEESKINCMSGMLLCFNRKERLVFILGAIFNVTDSVGSEILDISKVNFRKILSRSRQKLFSYMNDRCGFMNENNPCKCSHKWKALVERGLFDPNNLVYYRENKKSIREIIQNKLNDFSDLYYTQFIDFFRDQPFYDAPLVSDWFRNLLKREDFKEIFHLQ